MSFPEFQENNSAFDEQLGMALKLAEFNPLEAQRLATDCAQLISTSMENMERLENQGFFQRIWSKLNSQQTATQNLSINNLLQVQQKAFRYIELLNQNNLMMGESIITVKNQLNYIKTDNIETKKAVTKLAQKIKQKFESLERRIERLETVTAIHGWLLTIEEMEYVKRFPKNIRMLNIIRDFRAIKDKDWTISEIRCLKNAIRKSNIDPDERITLKEFLTGVAIENYPDQYSKTFDSLLMLNDVDAGRVQTEITLPMVTSMYQFADQYVTNAGVIQRVVEKYPDIPAEETVAEVMIKIVEESGVDMDAEIEYQHLALELLTGVNLAQYFASKRGFICSNPECIIHQQHKHYLVPGFCQECGAKLKLDQRRRS